MKQDNLRPRASQMGFHQLTKRFGATNRTPSEISLPWCLPEFEMNVNSASGGQVAKGLGARLKEKKIMKEGMFATLRKAM